MTGERGTTLLETLVATAICVTVVFALAGVVAMSTQQAKNMGSSVSQATSLASQKLDRLMALTFTSSTTDTGLTSGGDLTTNTTNYVEYLDATGTLITGGSATGANTFFTRRWKVTDVNSSPTTLKQIEVRVNAKTVGSGSADTGSGPSSTLACLKARQ